MYGHVITKFSWMGSLRHFLSYSAPLYINNNIYSLFKKPPKESKTPLSFLLHLKNRLHLHVYDELSQGYNGWISNPLKININ